MEHLQIPSTDDHSKKQYQLCILGEGAVGKSSLTIQFVQGIFLGKYDPTIEDVYQKMIEIDGKQSVIEILDTAGTETFQAMRDLYIRNGQGFVIVYSIISEDTFNQLHRIYNQIMTIKKEQPALVLVGNKLDLANEQRIVQREKGQQLADQWMCPFYETSAKDSINVDQIFLDLVRQIDRRLPCVRKASRQDDMPTLPINFPMKNYFCCPFFSRNKARQNKSTSQK